MANLELIRGDDYVGTRRLTILVTDPDAGDAPVDLTGTALTFLVKRQRQDTDAGALIAKTTGSGIVLANQATDPGEALISIAAADTNGLASGLFWWELQAVDAIGIVTLASGRIAIGADLVRGA